MKHTELPLVISDLNNPANTKFLLLAANNHHELVKLLTEWVSKYNAHASLVADTMDIIQKIQGEENETI